MIALVCFFIMPMHRINAQVVVTETQPLSFGTFAFASFNSVASIDIRTNGNINANGNVAIIANGSRGEFSLTGGPPNTTYTITTPSSFTLSGPGGDFNIDSITVRPNNLRTDGAGNDDFTINARLLSLGGGTAYNNGTYNNTFDITIAF